MEVDDASYYKNALINTFKSIDKESIICFGEYPGPKCYHDAY